MGISLASSSRGQLPLPPHTLSSTSSGAHVLICCRGHRPLVVSSPPHTLSSTSCGAHAPICCRGHRPLVVSPSPPHSLIYQPWCSCAHLLSWASSSRGQLPPHSLSSTSRGAHALICCRGHRPLEVSSLSPRSPSSTSSGAHVPICCRGHPPLVVCSLPHTLSLLLAVGLSRVG